MNVMQVANQTIAGLILIYPELPSTFMQPNYKGFNGANPVLYEAHHAGTVFFMADTLFITSSETCCEGLLVTGVFIRAARKY